MQCLYIAIARRRHNTLQHLDAPITRTNLLILSSSKFCLIVKLQLLSTIIIMSEFMAVNLRGRGRSSDAKDGLRCHKFYMQYIPTRMKNACYLSYLTFDRTNQQEPDDQLMCMTQPVLSLQLVALYVLIPSSEMHPFPCLPGVQRAPANGPFLANQCLCHAPVSSFFQLVKSSAPSGEFVRNVLQGWSLWQFNPTQLL